MDVHGIGANQNFETRLQEEVAACDAMVVVIGADWLETPDPRTGAPKINDPLDFVHIEMMTALIRRIPLAPVLIEQAKMPHASELPPLIRDLAKHQAQELPKGNLYDAAIDIIVTALRDALAAKRDETAAREVAALRRSEARAEAAETSLKTAETALAETRAALKAEQAARKKAETAMQRLEARRPAATPTANGRDLSGSIGRWLRTAGALTAPLKKFRLRIALAGAATIAAAGVIAVSPAIWSEARLALGGELEACEQCPKMVRIEGGTFLMGSPTNDAMRFADEGPQREVQVDAFAIGEREVTRAQWTTCESAGVCRRLPPTSRSFQLDFPVVDVTWNDAQKYIGWLNSQTSGEPFRLPTEAEWEYAARAGTKTRYSIGDRISKSDARFGGPPDVQGPTATKSFPPNAWGLYDIHGNAGEWTADCWNDDYRSAPKDARRRDSGKCDLAPIRSGGWRSNERGVRSAFRQRLSKISSDSMIGFRVARDL